MQTLFMILTFVTLFFLSKNIFRFMFAMENYNTHKKRLKQLEFQHKKETDPSELIDTVTKPIIEHLFSRIKPKGLDKLGSDLRMAKWDKVYTPIQYRAFNILLKVAGVFFFLILSKVHMGLASAWGIVLCFGIDFLLRNSISNRKEKLMMGFPEFIRVTTGYLTADIPFAQAVAEAIKYVDEEWTPILQSFVVECNLKSIDEALESLKNEVDLFEVREFVALVRLTLEQGGDAKESFSEQAQKVQEMLQDIVAIKVGKRQMMGVAIQAPLLLCNLMVFGLPTFSSMFSFSSM